MPHQQSNLLLHRDGSKRLMIAHAHFDRPVIVHELTAKPADCLSRSTHGSCAVLLKVLEGITEELIGMALPDPAGLGSDLRCKQNNALSTLWCGWLHARCLRHLDARVTTLICPISFHLLQALDSRKVAVAGCAGVDQTPHTFYVAVRHTNGQVFLMTPVCRTVSLASRCATAMTRRAMCIMAADPSARVATAMEGTADNDFLKDLHTDFARTALEGWDPAKRIDAFERASFLRGSDAPDGSPRAGEPSPPPAASSTTGAEEDDGACTEDTETSPSPEENLKPLHDEVRYILVFDAEAVIAKLSEDADVHRNGHIFRLVSALVESEGLGDCDDNSVDRGCKVTPEVSAAAAKDSGELAWVRTGDSVTVLLARCIERHRLPKDCVTFTPKKVPLSNVLDPHISAEDGSTSRTAFWLVVANVTLRIRMGAYEKIKEELHNAFGCSRAAVWPLGVRESNHPPRGGTQPNTYVQVHVPVYVTPLCFRLKDADTLARAMVFKLAFPEEAAAFESTNRGALSVKDLHDAHVRKFVVHASTAPAAVPSQPTGQEIALPILLPLPTDSSVVAPQMRLSAEAAHGNASAVTDTMRRTILKDLYACRRCFMTYCLERLCGGVDDGSGPANPPSLSSSTSTPASAPRYAPLYWRVDSIDISHTEQSNSGTDANATTGNSAAAAVLGLRTSWSYRTSYRCTILDEHGWAYVQSSSSLPEPVGILDNAAPVLGHSPTNSPQSHGNGSGEPLPLTAVCFAALRKAACRLGRESLFLAIWHQYIHLHAHFRSLSPIPLAAEFLFAVFFGADAEIVAADQAQIVRSSAEARVNPGRKGGNLTSESRTRGAGGGSNDSAVVDTDTTVLRQELRMEGTTWVHGLHLIRCSDFPSFLFTSGRSGAASGDDDGGGSALQLSPDLTPPAPVLVGLTLSTAKNKALTTCFTEAARDNFAFIFHSIVADEEECRTRRPPRPDSLITSALNTSKLLGLCGVTAAFAGFVRKAAMGVWSTIAHDVVRRCLISPHDAYWWREIDTSGACVNGHNVASRSTCTSTAADAAAPATGSQAVSSSTLIPTVSCRDWSTCPSAGWKQSDARTDPGVISSLRCAVSPSYVSHQPSLQRSRDVITSSTAFSVSECQSLSALSDRTEASKVAISFGVLLQQLTTITEQMFPDLLWTLELTTRRRGAADSAPVAKTPPQPRLQQTEISSIDSNCYQGLQLDSAPAGLPSCLRDPWTVGLEGMWSRGDRSSLTPVNTAYCMDRRPLQPSTSFGATLMSGADTTGAVCGEGPPPAATSARKDTSRPRLEQSSFGSRTNGGQARNHDNQKHRFFATLILTEDAQNGRALSFTKSSQDSAAEAGMKVLRKVLGVLRMSSAASADS